MVDSPTIRIMVEAVQKAGKSLTRDFGEVENLQVSKKGPADFVTAADLRSEKIIIESLQKSRPGFAILSEEAGSIAGTDAEHEFILDPLDGTSNFMHGLPHFSISLGLTKRKENGEQEVIAGVVYNPVYDEIFTAEKGKGAFFNQRRLRVGARKKLDEAVFATGIFGHGREPEAVLVQLMESIAKEHCGLRCLGSAALELAFVAAGKLDGFFHKRLKSWDMAAGILLVQEARGVVTDFAGSQNILAGETIVAGNEVLQSKMRALVTKFFH